MMPSVREALPLLSRAAVRALDAQLVARGIPSVLLMENAGRGAAEHIAARMTAAGLRRVVVLVGPGNNGGDGLVVARHLAAICDGATVRVLYACEAGTLQGDAAVMRDALGATAVHCRTATASDDPAALLGDAEVVVDALFGTGLTRPIEGLSVGLIDAANEAQAPRLRVALDTPSGLDVDRGVALGGRAFRADLTCTFATSKTGLHTGEGLGHAGEVVVVGLGVALDGYLAAPQAWLSLAAAPPSRSRTAHKGVAGRVLVVGGSAGTTGAALLAARAAHRTGAGLVTIASRAATSLEGRVVETMTRGLSDNPAEAVAQLSAFASRADAVVLGVGLGLDPWASALTGALWRLDCPLVVDADALGLLAALRVAGALPPRSAATVLTPHPLELARLLPEAGPPEAAWVGQDRPGAVRRAAAVYDAVVLLKGAGSLVSTPEGSLSVLPYANAALGVAGSGDVLAGAVAARLAERRGVDSARCTLEAAHAHGLAALAAARARGATRGLLAGEIAEGLSLALEHPVSDAIVAARRGLSAPG